MTLGFLQSGTWMFVYIFHIKFKIIDLYASYNVKQCVFVYRLNIAINTNSILCTYFTLKMMCSIIPVRYTLITHAHTHTITISSLIFLLLLLCHMPSHSVWCAKKWKSNTYTRPHAYMLAAEVFHSGERTVSTMDFQHWSEWNGMICVYVCVIRLEIRIYSTNTSIKIKKMCVLVVFSFFFFVVIVLCEWRNS